MSLAEFFQKARAWFSTSWVVYGNSLERWAIALGLFILLVIILKIAKTMVERRLETLAGRTTNQWDDALVAALRATKLWFVVTMAGCLALLTLDLPGEITVVKQV